MIPKRSDIVKTDCEVEARLVRSTMYGGFRETGDTVTFPAGTHFRFLRTRNDDAYVSLIISPSAKVRKMVRIINPDAKSRQTYALDCYSVSFLCKKDEYKPEMLLAETAS